jgi:hypothetical protein
MAKKSAAPDVINDVEDGKISPKEVYENYVKPLGMPKVYPEAAPTLPPAPIPGLTAGRMVHWVLPYRDAHRPAIITNVLDATDGTVNLVVFYDGEIDGRSPHNCSEWIFNVEYSEFNVVGTWHFIEKA